MDENMFFKGVLSDYQDEYVPPVAPRRPVQELSQAAPTDTMGEAQSFPYEPSGPVVEEEIVAEAYPMDVGGPIESRPIPRKPTPIQATSKEEFNRNNDEAIFSNEQKDRLKMRSRERVGDKAADLYYALADSETGGEDDPYIRTKYRDAPGGSSAFGPVQTTTKLLKGFKKKHGDIFDKEEKEFLNKMIRQGNKFLKHGNMKGKMENFDERYDYGGKGDLIQSEEDKELYERVTMKMVKQHLDDADGDVEEATRVWRWGPNHKGKKDDRYMKNISNLMDVEFTQI